MTQCAACCHHKNFTVARVTLEGGDSGSRYLTFKCPTCGMTKFHIDRQNPTINSLRKAFLQNYFQLTPDIKERFINMLFRQSATNQPSTKKTTVRIIEKAGVPVLATSIPCYTGDMYLELPRSFWEHPTTPTMILNINSVNNPAPGRFFLANTPTERIEIVEAMKNLLLKAQELIDATTKNKQPPRHQSRIRLNPDLLLQLYDQPRQTIAGAGR
jgi:hypothetical protein